MSIYVSVLAPEYANDPRMPAAMLLASEEVSSSHCYRERVVVLLAAHMLSMGDRAGVGGAVASKREGDLSVAFSQPIIGDRGLLADTGYGQEVQRLNRLCYGMTAMTGWSGNGEGSYGSEALMYGPLWTVRWMDVLLHPGDF